jgi:hypothetical protein
LVASIVASFIRKVPTASGARAVQIVHKQGRQVVGVEHFGSAHDDGQLAVLMEVTRARLLPGQDTLDLTSRSATRSTSTSSGPGADARVAGMSSRLLWDVLASAYERLGFAIVGDETFKRLVLARIIEPASKADTIRVLGEIGVAAPGLRTIFRSLDRCVSRDYRDAISKACVAHSSSARRAAMVMYDVTTLHFEAEKEDQLRRVGMSKEHRVEPQVQVGLLVDPAGFPLEIHLFEGKKAETKTLIPVLSAFAERHGVTDLVVVADAGMLSAGNLNALEDAGFSFIVGSRIAKAPYDLAEHFTRHGDYFADGQILESSRAMGTGKAAQERRVIYQYKFTRYSHDNRAINAMVARAEKITTGNAAMAKARFVKVTGATKELDQALIDRARQLAGLKGYVTNLPATTMDG